MAMTGELFNVLLALLVLEELIISRESDLDETGVGSGAEDVKLAKLGNSGAVYDNFVGEAAGSGSMRDVSGGEIWWADSFVAISLVEALFAVKTCVDPVVPVPGDGVPVGASGTYKLLSPVGGAYVGSFVDSMTWVRVMEIGSNISLLGLVDLFFSKLTELELDAVVVGCKLRLLERVKETCPPVGNPESTVEVAELKASLKEIEPTIVSGTLKMPVSVEDPGSGSLVDTAVLGVELCSTIVLNGLGTTIVVDRTAMPEFSEDSGCSVGNTGWPVEVVSATVMETLGTTTGVETLKIFDRVDDSVPAADSSGFPVDVADVIAVLKELVTTIVVGTLKMPACIGDPGSDFLVGTAALCVEVGVTAGMEESGTTIVVGAVRMPECVEDPGSSAETFGLLVEVVDSAVELNELVTTIVAGTLGVLETIEDSGRSVDTSSLPVEVVDPIAVKALGLMVETLRVPDRVHNSSPSVGASCLPVEIVGDTAVLTPLLLSSLFLMRSEVVTSVLFTIILVDFDIS